MAHPKDITVAFKTALLAANPGATVYDYLPGNITTPCFVTQYPLEVTYDFQMASSVTRWSFPIQAIVGRMDNRSAWLTIADYVDPENGVKAAIEADPTLGGVVESLQVTEAEIVVYSITNIDYLAAIFTVDVVA